MYSESTQVTDPACEPRECLRVLGADGRTSGSEVAALLRKLAPRATQTYYLDPSLLVLVALLGAELCPATLGDAELPRCLRALLDVDRLRLLPPAMPRSGAMTVTRRDVFRGALATGAALAPRGPGVTRPLTART